MHLYYVFLAIAPTLLWLVFFYNKDRWEPEPKSKVLKIFLIGFVATIPALITVHIFQMYIFGISHFMMQVSLPLSMTACFLVIAPIEEIFKYSVVKAFMFYDKEFDEKLDGVIYMVAAALGFAALENLIYIFEIRDPGDATMLALSRGVLAAPAHACFSGILGIFLGKAKFANTKMHKVGLIVIGFVAASVLHGLYDFLSLLPKPYSFSSIAFLVVVGAILLHNIKKLLAQSQYRKD